MLVWDRELLLLLRSELEEEEEMGGRPESEAFNPFSGLTVMFPALDRLPALSASSSVFPAVSGSVLCLCSCLEAAGRAGEGCFPAGEEALLRTTVSCDLTTGLSFSLCARAVIEDKWLDGFSEDINVSVRRGNRLRLRFVSRFLGCGWLVFLVGFFLGVLG